MILLACFMPLDTDTHTTTPPAIVQTLDQPFTYLGEGSQMVAYASEDGTCVLKLFKAKHKKKWKLSRTLRSICKTRCAKAHSARKWREKFARTRLAYQMAFESLPQETGLLYLHFGHSESPLPVTFHRRKTQTLDLSGYPFILQKRAELAPEYLHRMAHKGPQSLNAAIQSLNNLFTARTKKGFTDERQSLRINYGFCDGVAIQIDPGKIEKFSGDEELEMERLHSRVAEWTKRFRE